jgi:hypothetical protein
MYTCTNKSYYFPYNVRYLLVSRRSRTVRILSHTSKRLALLPNSVDHSCTNSSWVMNGYMDDCGYCIRLKERRMISIVSLWKVIK